MDPEFNLPTNLASALNEYINTAARFAWDYYPWPDLMVITTAEDNEFTIPGDVFGVYAKDPVTVGQTSQVRIPHRDVGASIILPNNYDKVWIEYRRPFIRYEGSDWSAGTYQQNTKVYDASTGDYYIALETTSGTPNNSTDWGRIYMPAILSEYIKAAATAEALRETGQYEQAEVQRRDAVALLNQKIDKLELQSGQVRTYGVALPHRT
tara:strand:- start:313 stop:939 length:627 start_codon:yes stop_codon:yes gene_type:complete